MPSALITRKGQVTIPKKVRDQVGLKIGDRVGFAVRDGVVILKPPMGTILDLQGSVRPSQHPEDFDRIREAVRRDRAEKAVRE